MKKEIKNKICFFGVLCCFFNVNVACAKQEFLPNPLLEKMIQLNVSCEQNAKRGAFFLAETECQQAVLLAQQHFSSSSLHATSLENLALFFRLNGFFEKEAILLKDALNIRMRLGNLSVSTHLHLLTALARSMWSCGNLKAAESYYVDALRLVEQTSNDHQLLLKHLDLLGWFYLKTERVEQAKKIYQRALLLAHKYLAKDNELRLLLQERVLELQ